MARILLICLIKGVLINSKTINNKITVGSGLTESAYNFNEQSDRSAVKTRIVTKYFSTWASIISSNNDEMYYIDLFSGQGKYDDGTESTPIEVMKVILQKPELKNKMHCYFNEGDEDRCKKLRECIYQCDGVQSLKYAPIVENMVVDKETYKQFENWNKPSFVFLDPCGYKGLSMNLISSFAESWGTDIIIFFNFNAINRSVDHESFEMTMKEVFGVKHYQIIQERINANEDRQIVILDEMIKALQDSKLQYVLPFSFKFTKMNRISHYILFATKNIKAFTKMKEIMYKEGGHNDNGEGRFEYIPVKNPTKKQRSLLDYFAETPEEFKIRLLSKYSGKELTTREIIDKDTALSRYIDKNYKDALYELFIEGKIECNRPPRRKYSMADNIIITFK